MKDLLWQLFKKTGKIEYYLAYKKQKDGEAFGGNSRKGV